MNGKKKNPNLEAMQTRFSILWIFAMFNYLYADVVTLMNPEILNKMITGNMGGSKITPEFLLIAAAY